jgi:uncharacterized protein (DUF3084 family)
MASDKSPFLVDAVKASASRFKETKNALDARQKELDARHAELDAQRADLERRSERLNAEREEFQREKDQVNSSRGAIDRDLATIRMEREKFGAEEKRIQDWSRTLGERERAIKEGEDRQTHLDTELSGHVRESEAKVNSLLEREETAAQSERALADTIEKLVMMERGLAERDKKLARREEELVKLQGDRLNALEAREREMLKISEDMQARQKDSAAQHESFVELQDTLRQELVRIAGERERLASKERSLVEAEKYLAAALEASGIEMSPVEEVKAPPPPPASEPRAPKPPTVAPSSPPMRGADPYREDIFEEEGRDAPEAKAKVSRADALERMTRALETAKRARDQGRNVSEIRKALKQARAAFESGDYETASRLAAEILRELEAIALTR